jgi:1-deoxy-D-xylulose-5-phosphate reductoisomerase
MEAIKRGGLYPTAANGANEEAVRLFLEGKIKFLKIAELVEKAMLSAENKSDFSVEDILAADKAARNCVIENI